MSSQARVAIIGAGLTGLSLAHALRDAAEVTVLEKSRGVGGRMSTRRAAPFAFDHGAQYFSARGAAFATFLEPFLSRGIIKPWAPRLALLPEGSGAAPDWSSPRYVAVPGMTALAKALAEELDVERAVHAETLKKRAETWHLMCREGREFGPFDWVISTAPAAQTMTLMPEEFSGQAALGAAKMLGCYSLMLGFSEPLALPWEAAWVQQDPLGWIAVDTSKPGRGAAHSILAQTSNSWAEANLERDQSEVQAELLRAFGDVTGQSPRQAAYVSLHRWRYASVATPASSPFLIDTERRLAAAGDWCGAGKVEAAFDSASALADALRPTLAEQRSTQ
ncbi:FAD-dependent oxidoreductase [uncultured Roseobacter sp.]|uniref:NAD(P)/FAD-dependent oxidoreductase n=1 Tax=uncultured Roseobacter sp. TaxID=114847 RepID=UPI002628EE73|nr:FAD-dependent oxidoreductase [uncultured Roseobacter sp.]